MSKLELDPRLNEAYLASLPPADRRHIYEWAHDNILLPEALAKPGRFDISTSQYLVEPFRAMEDDYIRQVVLVAPVRSGKSLIADIWLPWAVVNDPGPFMWNMQTDVIAKDHAESRIMPTLKKCAPVANLLHYDRHKTRTQSIIFAHGMALYVQGPSIGNLQSKGIRYQVNDEVWLWEPGRLAEATARVGDFEALGTSKIFICSQAGNEGDDLDVEFCRGDRRELMIQCEACRHYMLPRWTGKRKDGSRWGMRWDKHKTPTGAWDISKTLPTVRFECEKCGHPHIYGAKLMEYWNHHFKYAPMNPTAPRKLASFHYSGIITRQWDLLVEEYLSAQNAFQSGAIQPLITFFQKRLAEPASEQTILEQSHEIKRIDYKIDKEWKEEVARLMTVDRQEEDLYWVTIRAWSKDGHSRRLWFGKLFSDADIEAKRDEMKIQPNHLFIDSGYHPKGDHGVYSFCVKYGWVAFKGEDPPSGAFWHTTGKGRNRKRVRRSYAPLTYGDPESGTGHQGRTRAPLIRFAASAMKDRVNQLIKRGYWQEPAADPEDPLEKEYSKQMTAEFKKAKKDKFTGRVDMVWVCPSRNNHAFDCASMQVTGAILLDLLPDNIEAAD